MLHTDTLQSRDQDYGIRNNSVAVTYTLDLSLEYEISLYPER